MGFFTCTSIALLITLFVFLFVYLSLFICLFCFCLFVCCCCFLFLFLFFHCCCVFCCCFVFGFFGFVWVFLHIILITIVPFSFLFSAGLCSNVTMVKGVGYRLHPRDCDKYIQCYYNPNGQTIGVIRDCPFGHYWNQDILRCDLACNVDCPLGEK